ncbi:MAG TPA: VacB/RNase II family 3'-5' exoribonuclease, partial [Pseudomonadales bacterium]|nr:VacB/RNase II family 3'-5' exoribonuclease [Pseudomonadales bacterium]
NPQVDRLALVAEIQISASGKVSRFRFCEAVFQSHARLTYTQVGAYLADPAADIARPFHAEWKFLQKPLQDAYELYQLLRSVRDDRGAIDFETNETRIIFGKDRKIEKIVPTERNEAHKLIEEFMLCANVAAAKLLEKHKIAILYRVHEGPKDEKLNNLRVFLNEIGISMGGGDTPQPGDYQAVLNQIEDRPDARLIQTIMLRSMSQAIYTPENKGHFGLAYPAYTHFTSPIRRYPDLLVHRAIRFLLRSAESPQLWKADDAKLPIPREKIFPYDFAAMVELGEHTSMTERRADDATRDAVAWLKCEYMVDHVGEVFSGIISAVTSFGFFAELDQIFVEGLVHVSSLPGDYYHFDAIQHRLKGERTGTLFCLGDEVQVKVVKVDLDGRKIDFELVEGGARHRRGKQAASKSAPKNKGKGKGKGKLSALNRFDEAKKSVRKAKSDKSPKAKVAEQAAPGKKKKKKNKGKQKLSGRELDSMLTDSKDYVAGKVANKKSKGKPAR